VLVVDGVEVPQAQVKRLLERLILEKVKKQKKRSRSVR
jgi:arginine repressor